MDGQFNTLVQSFRDNYLQYKITGAPKYQSGYSAAQSGIQSILDSLQAQVNSQQAKISEFYKEGVEEKLQELDSENKSLQRGIMTDHDEAVAAEMRSQSNVYIPTWQYITLGGLVVGSLVVSLM